MSGSPAPTRADPFGNLDDLADFKPTVVAKRKPEAAAVREASEKNNFPSRAPAKKAEAAVAPASRAQRRHRTGRNVQFNIKATAQTIERFVKLAEDNGWVFGEALDRALDALEASLPSKASR